MDFSFFVTMFTSWWFYAILVGIALVPAGWVLWRKIFRKVPILNRKKTVLLIGVLGLVLTSGLLAGLGFGSFSGITSPSGVHIMSLQQTTPFTANSTTQTGTDNTRLVDIRLTDAAIENDNIIQAGLLQVVRTGDLSAMSCPIHVHPMGSEQDESTPTGVVYHLVETDVNGIADVFVETDGGAATSSDPRMDDQLAFAEGVATGVFSLYVELDADGLHDHIAQYSYRDIVVDVCDWQYTLRVHNMGAT